MEWDAAVGRTYERINKYTEGRKQFSTIVIAKPFKTNTTSYQSTG